MKRILAVVILALSPFMFGFVLQWEPPTQYTDNTVIPATKTIYYDAWVDGARFYTRGTAPSVTVPSPGSGVAHLYEVTAIVDNVSSARAGINWTSPLVTPGGPANLRVVP